MGVDRLTRMQKQCEYQEAEHDEGCPLPSKQLWFLEACVCVLITIQVKLTVSVWWLHCYFPVGQYYENWMTTKLLYCQKQCWSCCSLLLHVILILENKSTVSTTEVCQYNLSTYGRRRIIDWFWNNLSLSCPVILNCLQ